MTTAARFGAFNSIGALLGSYPDENLERLEAIYAENRWIQKQVVKATAPPKQNPRNFSDLVSAIDALHDAVASHLATTSEDELELPNTGSNLTKKAFAAGFTDQHEYERSVSLGYKNRAEYAPALLGAQMAARKKAREAINNGTARF
ncbi:MAG: hypothetical protein J0G95_04550 [Rhizobiales bacterium]|nr:hypothetical protein [Hyphomicrobiales bacterium]